MNHDPIHVYRFADRDSYGDGRLEYFHHGHDEAEPLFDVKFAKSWQPDTNLCFAGIGDGRHLFATLIAISKHEIKTSKNSNYHITINDINPHCIARLLVFFHTCTDMAKARSDGKLKQAREMFLTTLYYIFASLVMPACVFNRVHTTIFKIIDILEKGEATPGIDVSSCRASVLRALISWRDKVPTYVPVATILQMQVDSQNQDLNDRALGTKDEQTFFKNTGAILAPHLLQTEEKQLQDPVAKFKRSPTNDALEAARSYLAANWKPNVTIFDLDWIKDHLGTLSINYDPFGLAGALYNDRCVDEAYIPLKKPKKSSSLSKLMNVTFVGFSGPIHPQFPLLDDMRWGRASSNPLPYASLCSLPRDPLSLHLGAIEESRKNHPLKKLSMAPCVSEMRTLSTLFQRFLPFAISTVIPKPETTHRYEIRIPTLHKEIPNKILGTYISHHHTQFLSSNNSIPTKRKNHVRDSCSSLPYIFLPT